MTDFKTRKSDKQAFPIRSKVPHDSGNPSYVGVKKEQIVRKDDLELKDLEQYHGTEKYVNVMGVKATDGVGYIMQNGYSWFVTDLIANIKFVKKLKGQEFLSIDLKLKPNKKAEMVITDGNNNVLHVQKYDYTDAKKEFKLFYTNNVLMYSGEY